MTVKKNYTDISSVLNSVLDKYQLRTAIEKEHIFTNWEKLVGKEIAKMCKPVSLQGDELTLKAKDTLWRQELATRQKDLLNLLNGRIKTSLLKKIKII